MIPLSSEISSRIRFLLQNLNDDDFDTVFQELREVLQSQALMASSSRLPQEMEKLNVTYASPDSYDGDVEAESNLYLHYIFSGQLTIVTIIKMLARFKESSERRDQSLFKCILHTMFEEYQFLSKYPDMQLKIAAAVLGSLIKHQLVTQLSLGIGLRGVLDALAKPSDSKMFGFGIKALEQFVERLIEWPHYCTHILKISHLRATHPHLIKSIEGALKKISAALAETDDSQDALIQSSANAMSMEIPVTSCSFAGFGSLHAVTQVPQRPLSSTVDPSVRATGTKPQSRVGVASVSASPDIPSSSGTPSTIASEERDTPIEAPESEIQDNISFIINNLSPSNIDDKAKQFIGIMQEEHYPWFAQYIVVKRIGLETNFHDLYLNFLDKVNLKALNREIVDATYKSCKVLLKSDLINSSVEERTVLKSLGSWLGKITIGKNHFLRAQEIDPKSLLVEAYEKGLMIAIVPFLSKILQSCSSSIAFKPPNPWTIGLLELFAEIYDMPNLKMDLQFEIDGLFRNLGLNLEKFTRGSLLNDRVREVKGNPDFSREDYGSSRPEDVISTPSKDEAPESEIHNEISSIINNLSPDNIDDQAKQFIRIMKTQNYPWFAQYIMERISIETNLHDLYSKFLDKVNQIPLDREIVAASCENCKVLLQSDLIKSSMVVRWRLKNLGRWLGKITIGKNQALSIDLQSLIQEAIEKGIMSAIIPFISKILESCSTSEYQPPNPWTVSILGLFAEIYYGVPNLKMNLKVEIEVLFKNLGGKPDFSRKDTGSSSQTKEMICKLSKVEANIERLVVVNKSLWAYGLHLHFQRALPMAMKGAVNEMLTSIVPRSVAIATRTTKELALKDYSMTLDEMLMCEDAYLMVAMLASALAYVTCKEPLRVCLSSLIVGSLSPLGSSTSHAKFLELAGELVTNENLDLAYALIEQAATEQAVQAIEEEIARSLLLNSPGQNDSFSEVAMHTSEANGAAAASNVI